MSTVTEPQPATDEAEPKKRAKAAPAAKIRKVRGPWFAAGGILIALAMAGALYLYGQTATREQYLAIVDDMVRGDVLTREDLGLVGLQADTELNFVRPGEADIYVGQRLVADLDAGTLLTPDLVSLGENVPDGKALVGLDLPAGNYPAANTGPGDYVSLIGVGRRTADEQLWAYELSRAEVISRTVLSDSNLRLFLTVMVDEERANVVSPMAAAGGIYVVQVADLEPGPLSVAPVPIDGTLEGLMPGADTEGLDDLEGLDGLDGAAGVPIDSDGDGDGGSDGDAGDR